ncbi:MAG: hypothetical protein KBC30_11375 [Planctomycetes bacterium]|nr:hypothetical protein [Planctomycetota bacterium]HNZ66856.1 hypothetical protein [Planctomycetota bacterium]HPY75225.1 hypothetical protein [Planctomycetota bacterium]HQB00507.1 hypothetical protein [Planctomycetota bacterium]
MLWGGNVALGCQSCSGEGKLLWGIALGRCSGEMLWGGKLLWGEAILLWAGIVLLLKLFCCLKRNKTKHKMKCVNALDYVEMRE